MKKSRGFRLGRKIVRIWRWVFRRRRPKIYHRLNPTRSQSQSTLYRSKTHCSKTITSTMTTKLFDWGRDLTSRLRSSVHGGGKRHFRRLGDRPSAGDWEVACDDVALLEHHKVELEGRKPPPKGHLVVYVGGQKDGGPPRRYLVPVFYFNHPLFGELLREAEEEFGYHHPGGITIPCPVSRFERVQTRIAAGQKTSQLHWFHSKHQHL
ncbi:auxin-responsive protein SAUR36 [Cocos nucifera]|uniref:Auxin-responsive protein SAUR36 n=1 Tax=Cocos nucifera TaxID=13894 RepID=A0A8K0ILM3_COCNU|nr:auxin-responsive protein SAUR36 [Cocos nucifera]